MKRSRRPMCNLCRRVFRANHVCSPKVEPRRDPKAKRLVRN